MGKHLTEDVTPKIAGKTFPAPAAGDDGKFLKYVHAASEYAWTATGGSFAGTMDDITDGVTYVKTENNLTDAKESTWNAKSDLTLAAVKDALYPVGAIYCSVVSTSPATLFGGTWSAFGAGKVLVGIDAGQTEFDTVEETGGEKTHTLITAEMPAHTHTENAPSSASGGALKFGIDTNASGTQDAGIGTGSAGSNGAHNNLQPYIVCYFWKRTA